MKTRFILTFLLTQLLLLTGCINLRVISDVTCFHNLPQVAATKTFRFLPTETQKGSLEYASYASLIRQKLQAYGWRYEENDKQMPDYLVVFTYGIDDGRVITESIPLFGQTGGGAAYSSGTVRTASGSSATYTGTTYQAPTFGQVGAIPVSRKEYRRIFQLSILDAQKSTPESVVKSYEGRVTSSGYSGEISTVLPTMIAALFDTFPGVSGKTRGVVIPIRP
jgi:hypothetical protein